jgi:hypothetical protein
MSHVHTRDCNRVAVIHVRVPGGVEGTWRVAASCKDNEKTLRAHLARWKPSLEFLRVEFESPAKDRQPSPEPTASPSSSLGRDEDASS